VKGEEKKSEHPENENISSQPELNSGLSDSTNAQAHQDAALHSGDSTAKDDGEVPVHCWNDEDPQSLPEVILRAGESDKADDKKIETLEEHTNAETKKEVRSLAGDRSAETLLADANSTISSQASSTFDPNAGQPSAAAQALQAPPETSGTNSSATTFECDQSTPLPSHEATQEYTPHKRKKNRPSLLSRIVNVISWLVIVAFFGCVIFGVLYYRYAVERLYTMQFNTNRTVTLTVEPGDRLSNIIEKLRREGLLGSFAGIDDGYLLRFLAWQNQNSSKIKSGIYKLNSSMSLREIYDKLIAGSQDFKVTIPEGKTAEETAAIIKRKIENFNEERFLSLVHDPKFIKELGLDVTSLEGYLYPSTYYFGPKMKEEDLIRMMVKTFIQTAESHLSKIERTETSDPLSFHEHLIVASLIEREARVDTERPLIASVIFNRLKKGMKLEIDATVNYALGDWGRRLKYDDLRTSSPYNTYLHKGLPPGPICNPHISSLIATYQPAQTNYLYYVYKGDGTHAFAETFEEHQANIRLYRRGGAALKTEESEPSGVSGSPLAPSDENNLSSSPAKEGNSAAVEEETKEPQSVSPASESKSRERIPSRGSSRNRQTKSGRH